ncbi:MAG: phage tail sheath subtilisin-like domain-containing protein [Roseiflexaceae bacterium]|nr:phage tail sheath subtilisin-like domain-containing protein [Roseiflexaceae bacterium]
MPVALTYPGVYIQEIPSGVRTITGVATSITAFVGRTLRGPVNQAVTINSFGDFERSFGGLWVDSLLSYAVRDFFLNGGGQAIIVRLTDKIASEAIFDTNGLLLTAVSKGAWGTGLRARVDTDVHPVDDPTLFNLTVRDTTTGLTEVFRNVSVANGPRRIDRVLANESNLVRVQGALPTTPPTAHGVPTAGKSIWEDDTASSKVDDKNKGLDSAALGAEYLIGSETGKTGIYALEQADLFNLLCIPPDQVDKDISTSVITEAAVYCEKRRALLIIDPLVAWKDMDTITKDATGRNAIGTISKNAAVFFPRLMQPNPLRGNQIEAFAACGAVAGIIARTDTQRGIWKAPAGLDATLVGVQQLSIPLTDAENGQINPLGINCIRALPAVGPVIWGARTLQGDDRLASEWKYIPVRRLALYIEESLYRGTQWVVFEPNDEPLWSQIRLNLGAFMHNLFRQGAFQGRTPREAYFVKCDSETTTQNDINNGIVNIIVGFAPLKPAEFVVISLQQIAGQISV